MPPPEQTPAHAPLPLPAHPSARKALVLGLVGLLGFFCLVVPVLASPFAWYHGAVARREIDREPSRWGGRDNATTGMLLGIVGTVLLVGALLFALALVLGLVLLTRFNGDY